MQRMARRHTVLVFRDSASPETSYAPHLYFIITFTLVNLLLAGLVFVCQSDNQLLRERYKNITRGNESGVWF